MRGGTRRRFRLECSTQSFSEHSQRGRLDSPEVSSGPSFSRRARTKARCSASSSHVRLESFLARLVVPSIGWAGGGVGRLNILRLPLGNPIGPTPTARCVQCLVGELPRLIDYSPETPLG